MIYRPADDVKVSPSGTGMIKRTSGLRLLVRFCVVWNIRSARPTKAPQRAGADDTSARFLDVYETVMIFYLDEGAKRGTMGSARYVL